MSINQKVDDAVEKGLATRQPDLKAAIVTWRYLRLALVVLAVGLMASILYEGVQAGCAQTSISAYYYTPVQGILVGTLVAIGVCLVCLRGASDGEDVLLNLAGVCAPFVALVPTPNAPVSTSAKKACGTVLTDAANRDPNVSNNVFALLVLAWLSLLILTVLTKRRPPTDQPSRMDVRGFEVALAVLVLATAIFWFAHPTFLSVAHYFAAVSMFVFIIFNVRLNAHQRYLVRRQMDPATRRFNRYSLIASIMVADVVLHGVLFLFHWRYWILTIEATLIILFTIFWTVQTFERWKDGITPDPGPLTGPPAAPPVVAAGQA